MKCEKVREFFPGLAANHLEGSQLDTVRMHLNGCPDCEKSFEKTKSLKALLALKRHEKPDEFFFRTYTAEFHRRLYNDLLQKQMFWNRLKETLIEKTPAYFLMRGMKYAGVVILTFILSSAYFQRQGVHREGRFANHTVSAKQQVVGKESSLDQASYQPTTHDSFVITF